MAMVISAASISFSCKPSFLLLQGVCKFERVQKVIFVPRHGEKELSHAGARHLSLFRYQQA